jgi:hypothetical protein
MEWLLGSVALLCHMAFQWRFRFHACDGQRGYGERGLCRRWAALTHAIGRPGRTVAIAQPLITVVPFTRNSHCIRCYQNQCNAARFYDCVYTVPCSLHTAGKHGSTFPSLGCGFFGSLFLAGEPLVLVECHSVCAKLSGGNRLWLVCWVVPASLSACCI